MNEFGICLHGANMQILKNGHNVSPNKVNDFKIKLRSESCVTLESMDHLEHISAYLAWKEVGGNIFVKSPLLPKLQKEHVDKELSKLNLKNNIVFHTSGTTGYPKLVVQDEKFIDNTEKLSTDLLGWHKDTRYFNIVPPFVSGFWHIILSAFVKNDATLILSSRETLAQDFSYKPNLTLWVPGIIDQMRSRNIKPPLQMFEQIMCGASQVLPRHAQFCFDNGCSVFHHSYGSTETGSPILAHKSFEMNDNINCLELTDKAKLVNDELIYDGISTGDLFDTVNGMIRFRGRTNDLAKINGYMCSLLLIENTLEELNLGETIAVVKNKMGTDYIELYHTEGNPDVTYIKEKLLPLVPECAIPLKYSKVESIPKNALNKKTRYAL